MTYTCFGLDVTEGVAHLQLSRPEAYNSMVPDFWTELPEVVKGLDDTGEARVIVLSSTGKHFCAGMDLAVFTSGSSGSQPEGAHGRGALRETGSRTTGNF